MKSTITDLVDQFADSVTEQNRAIKVGNTKEARRQGNRRTPIAKKLLGLDDVGRKAFATLLHHGDRIVRVAASVYLFSSMPEEVLRTLQDIAEGDDFAAMCAKLRIREWEEHHENYD